MIISSHFTISKFKKKTLPEQFWNTFWSDHKNKIHFRVFLNANETFPEANWWVPILTFCKSKSELKYFMNCVLILFRKWSRKINSKNDLQKVKIWTQCEFRKCSDSVQEVVRNGHFRKWLAKSQNRTTEVASRVHTTFFFISRIDKQTMNLF